MPEPHSKHILWYRCYALCSKLLGMAMGTMDAGEWLANYIASNGPNQITTLPLPNGFLYQFFRHLPASSLLMRMRFISESSYLLRQDMLYQGVTVWTKNLHDSRVLCLKDTNEFPQRATALKTRKLMEVGKRHVDMTTSLLVTHLINTSLGADQWPKASKF